MPTRTVFLLIPCRNRLFGDPASIIQFSTVPSGFFTAMCIQACGLIHSIFVTVPVNLTGFLASNSEANA